MIMVKLYKLELLQELVKNEDKKHSCFQELILMQNKKNYKAVLEFFFFW